MSDSDIKQLIKKPVAVRGERDWKQFHHPKYLDYKNSGGSRQQTGTQQELTGTKDLQISTVALQTSAKLAWLHVANFGKRTKKRIEEIDQILIALKKLGQL